MKTNNEENNPIGIFDSGVGGLTVARGIHDRLPSESIIYLGDTLHLPYGDKSSKAILQYAHRITDFLLEQNCKLIVIACNTASAVAYQSLKERLKNTIPVVNVIDPVVQAVTNKQLKNIAVIATQRTIKSQLYPQKLKQQNPNIQVFDKAAPSLASIIEEGMYLDNQAIKAIIAYYLKDEAFDRIDGLILACTHYPIIRDQIQDYLKKRQQNKPVQLFDSTTAVAHKVYDLLKEANLLNRSNSKTNSFYITDYTDSFVKTARNIFGDSIQLQSIELAH